MPLPALDVKLPPPPAPPPSDTLNELAPLFMFDGLQSPPNGHVFVYDWADVYCLFLLDLLRFFSLGNVPDGLRAGARTMPLIV